MDDSVIGGGVGFLFAALGAARLHDLGPDVVFMILALIGLVSAVLGLVMPPLNTLNVRFEIHKPRRRQR